MLAFSKAKPPILKLPPIETDVAFICVLTVVLPTLISAGTDIAVELTVRSCTSIPPDAVIDTALPSPTLNVPNACISWATIGSTACDINPKIVPLVNNAAICAPRSEPVSPVILSDEVTPPSITSADVEDTIVVCVSVAACALASDARAVA